MVNKIYEQYYFSYDKQYEFEYEDKSQFIVDYYFSDNGGLDIGGENLKLLKYVYNYLKILKDKNFPKDHSAEYYIIMNVFEDNKISESGVSIRCGWLTERGKKLLEDIETLFKGD